MRRALITTLLLLLFCSCKSDTNNNSNRKVEIKSPVKFSVLYDISLRDYLLPLVKAYQASEPKIVDGHPAEISLLASSSAEAMRSVADGRVKADLWINVSDTYVKWANNHLENLGAKHSGCKKLFSTPIVFAGKKDILEKTVTDGALFPLAKAVNNGIVKLTHLIPTTNSTGIFSTAQFISNISSQTTMNKKSYLHAQKFIHDYDTSPQALLNQAALASDSLILTAVPEQSLLNFKDKDRLRTVEAPNGNYSLEYQICMSNGDWATPKRKAAAKTFINWMTNQASQARASEFGYRPQTNKQQAQSDAPPQLSLSGEELELLTKEWQSARRKTSLVVIVDRSGSIDPVQLSSAQRMLRYLFAKRDKQELTSLLTVSTEPHLEADFNSDAKSLTKKTDRLYPLGGSALYDSIRLGFDQFQSDTYKKLNLSETRRTILIVTDGGDKNSRISLSAIKHVIKTRTKSLGIKVIILALPTTPELLGNLKSLTTDSSATLVETTGYELEKHIDKFAL